MKKTTILFLAVIVYITSCKTTSEVVDLKLQMPKGSQYEYTTAVDMNMTQNVQGQEIKMKNKMTFVYLFDIISDSANWKTVTSTIQQMKMEMDAMGQNMSIDTDNMSDTSGPMGMMNKMFGGIKGKQFSFTINDKGEVGKVTGMRELVESMVPADMPNREQALQQMSGSINEESFRQNIQQTFAVFPKQPVKIGESWTDTTTMSNQGMMTKSVNNYTLESVNDGKAVIKVTSALSSAQAQINGMDMTLNGSNNGKYTYDMSTGMVLSGDLKMIMDMEMSTQGQKMPMKIESDIKITSKKK